MNKYITTLLIILLITISACTLIFIGGNGHTVTIDDADSHEGRICVDSNKVFSPEKKREVNPKK